MNESMIILAIAVCVVAFIGIVYSLYKIYKCIQMACYRNDDNYGTYTTVASVSSDGRLKSLLKVPGKVIYMIFSNPLVKTEPV